MSESGAWSGGGVSSVIGTRKNELVLASSPKTHRIACAARLCSVFKMVPMLTQVDWCAETRRVAAPRVQLGCNLQACNFAPGWLGNLGPDLGRVVHVQVEKWRRHEFRQSRAVYLIPNVR